MSKSKAHEASMAYIARMNRRLLEQPRRDNGTGPSARVPEQDRPEDRAYAQPLSAIEREEIHWLWPPWIPLGMLSLIFGDPGLGKSLLALLLAARTTRAGGDVLLLSAEDHPAATIRPRAEALNADLDRLHIVGMRRDGLEAGLVLPDDARELDRLVRDVPKPKLVIVDPLMAHLTGTIDSHRDKDVRTALAPLARLAADRGPSVVCVAHMNKARGQAAMYRAGGSVGVIAATRSALLLARDPTEGERGPKRILALVKSNVADEAEAEPQACEIKVSGDGAPVFAITGSASTTTAELLDVPVGSDLQDRDEAIEFLRAELESGDAIDVAKIRKASMDAGIGPGSLKRAKRVLGVQSKKEGMQGGWSWRLPKGDGPPKGTALETPDPSPSSPSAFQAVSRGSEGGGFPEGDGPHDTGPFEGVRDDGMGAT